MTNSKDKAKPTKEEFKIIDDAVKDDRSKDQRREKFLKLHGGESTTSTTSTTSTEATTSTTSGG